MTWRAVLRRLRVLRAIELLAAGEGSVTTIAHEVGYTLAVSVQRRLP